MSYIFGLIKYTAMQSPSEIQPTEAELAILQALWRQQPASVKEVHEQLSDSRDVGYTTILKQMQRMFEKGWLKRSRSGKVHLYTAVVREGEIQQNLINRLVDTAFQGSPLKLVMRALGRDTTSQEELEAVQRWLDEQKNNQ